MYYRVDVGVPFDWLYNSFSPLFRLYQPVSGKKIHWPGDGPPADVPLCGFLGNDPSCQGSECKLLVINGPLITEIYPPSYLDSPRVDDHQTK